MGNEAQIAAAINAGTAKAALQNGEGSPLGQLLESLTQDIIDELQTAMSNHKVGASLNLQQSTKPTEVQLNGSEVSVGITMEFYWKFVNYGVNGTETNRGAPQWGAAPSTGQSFKQSIGTWVSQKGIGLPEQFTTFDQFAYAIMTNLRKHGQKPKPFFEEVINPSLIETLKKPIEVVLGRAIELTIISPFK